MASAPGSVSMTEDGDCGSARTPRSALIRSFLTGTSMDRRLPVWSTLSWSAIGAARLARLTRSSASAGGFLCSVAALNNVRTGVPQLADLLEMGLGGSALATRSPSVPAWTRGRRRRQGTPIRRR